MLNAAIIDDGVNQVLDGNWLADADSVICVAKKWYYKKSKDGHADICMKVIKHYLTDAALQNVSWHSIKILDDIKQSGNINSFIKALEFCLEMNIKFIHLSIGSSHVGDFKQIENIITKLLRKETIIVAAASNKGIITYPACLNGVFGVKQNPLYSGKQFSICSAPHDGIQFIASSRHGIAKIHVPISNSFAAPLISSIILNYLVDNPNACHSEVLRNLEKAKLQSKGISDYIEVKPGVKIIKILSQDLCSSKSQPSGPIVVIKGFREKDLITTLHRLFNRFHNDGYYVKAVTDSDATVAQRFCSIPPTIKINEYLGYLSYYYQCDILLVGLVSKSLSPRKTDDILEIIRADNTEYLAHQNEFHWNPNDGNYLYEKLIEILK